MINLNHNILAVSTSSDGVQYVCVRPGEAEEAFYANLNMLDKVA